MNVTGYARLLSKLGRAGRLTAMGHNDLNDDTSYTVQYAPNKTIRVTVKGRDYFTMPQEARDEIYARYHYPVDRGGQL
jgi:hypothetical protein